MSKKLKDPDWWVRPDQAEALLSAVMKAVIKGMPGWHITLMAQSGSGTALYYSSLTREMAILILQTTIAHLEEQPKEELQEKLKEMMNAMIAKEPIQ